MSQSLLLTSNRAVLTCLQQCIASPVMRGPLAATIHEFEDCRYSVQRCAEGPEYAILSFSHPYELSAAAREYASETYAGIAELDTPAQNSYQMSLKVSFPRAGQDRIDVLPFPECAECFCNYAQDSVKEIIRALTALWSACLSASVREQRF